MRRNKSILCAVTLATTVASGLAFAPPASAATFSCPDRSICLWSDGGFSGNRQVISGYTQYTDLSSHLHDKASSWGSTTRSQWMCVYNYRYTWTGTRYRVTLQAVAPGARVAVVPLGTNDKADAVGWC